MYRHLFQPRHFGCRAVLSAPAFGQQRVSRRPATVVAAVAEGTVASDVEVYPTVPFRASIDFKSIVENVELHTKNGADRFTKADPAKVAKLYQQFVQLTIQTNDVRSERNAVSNAMKVSSVAWPASFIRRRHTLAKASGNPGRRHTSTCASKCARHLPIGSGSRSCNLLA